MAISIETGHGIQKSTFVTKMPPASPNVLSNGFQCLQCFYIGQDDKMEHSVSILVDVLKAEDNTKGTKCPYVPNQRANPPNQDMLKVYETSSDTPGILTPFSLCK